MAFAGGEVRGYMIALHARSHLITVFVERAEQLAEVMRRKHFVGLELNALVGKQRS